MKTSLFSKSLCILCLFFSGCIKPDVEKEYTISGYLYQNCNRTPIANKTLTLWQGGYSGGEVGTTTTDVNGYFSVKYKPKGVENVGIGVRQAVGYGEYARVTPYKDYNNAIFYIAPTTYIKVSIQVYNNSYTNRDTFSIGDFGKNGGSPIILKIPGPFTSGPLFDVPNYVIQNYFYDGTYLPLITTLNNSSSNYGKVEVKSCDTTNLVMEIR